MLHHFLPTVKSSSNQADVHLYLPEWYAEQDGPMDASVSDKCPMFSKDSWRFLPSVSVKHETYTKVYDANVPNIPGNDFIIAGDLLNGDRRIQQLIDSEQYWLYARARITWFKHYRLALTVVGRDLTTFTSTKEFLTAVRDAMQAHWEAFVIMKLLHHDISPGNIIIYNGGGLLIDWEVAKDVNEVGGRRHDRTGTWQFASAALLRDPGKKHDLTDDLESFLHVLGWTVLRYLAGADSYAKEDRRDDMAMFDETSHRPSHVKGGRTKAERFRGETYPSEFFLPGEATPLWPLITTLASPFKSFYAAKPPTEHERMKFKVMPFPSIDDPDALMRWGEIYQYEQGINRLQSSTWFLHTIDHALRKPACDWPTDDKAVLKVHTPMPLVPPRSR